MIDAGGLEYAHARLSARNGERPREADWQRIEVARELAAALDAASATRLRHLVAGITPSQGAHDIEARLRGRWRALVAEVAAWMPGEWWASLAWCAVLVDLPALQYLMRGGRALPWMREDPIYRYLCADDAATRTSALLANPLAPLAPAWSGPERLFAAWRAEFVRRLPRHRLAGTPLLERLVAMLEQHVAAFARAASSDGWPLRRALQARLAALFRRATLDAAEAFAFLALAALDIERLRGELVRRAAFPQSLLAA